MDLRLQPSFLNCYSSLINLYTIFANQNLGMNFNDIINQLIIQSVRLLGVVILPILILFLNPEQIPFKKSYADCVFTEMNFELIEANSFSFDNNQTDNTHHYFIFQTHNPLVFTTPKNKAVLALTYHKFAKEILESGIFIPPPEIV